MKGGHVSSTFSGNMPASADELGTMRALLAAILGLISVSLLPAASRAAPKAADLVRAELLAEPRAISPGQTFTVGLRLTMADRWHTYWRNPGDSGLSTEIAWTLPSGFSAGQIHWPTPTRIPVSHLVNYGYEGETTLLVDITAPMDLSVDRPVELKALVSYLVCERECIPGEAALSTSLQVASGPEGSGPDGATRYIFEAARASLPQPAPWPTRLEPADGRLKLRVEAASLPADLRSAYFFPTDETVVEHAGEQTLAIDEGGLTLTLQPSALAAAAPRRDIPGVLVLERVSGGGASRQAFGIGSVSATGSGTRAAATVWSEAAPAPVRGAVSVRAILQAALLAFLGGLILNLMPCVFPVLSIKVLSLLTHSGEGRAAIRLGGVAYAAGVVSSFAALAAILLVVRAGGSEVGWGFQLQSPLVVAGLACLLFAMGLGLSGAVEIGTSLAGRAGGLADRPGASGSFLTGVLAAAVAAPCTAPFMGAAIGYALTAPAAVALTVFIALGLGMSAPFLLLAFWPGLLARLPRPGAWMEIVKQVLAFPLYATVAWLLFVLSQQVGPSGLFAALLGLVLVAFALWSWQIANRVEGWPRGLGRGAVVASLCALGTIGWVLHSDRAAPDMPLRSTGTARPERFTQARLDALRAEGRPVFVNMTAAWCITCIVNERAVLSTAAVKARFQEAGITYLKGDWTNQNPEITRLLERHGRSGVPLYVLYPGRGEPVVLPEILTASIVLDSLGRVPSLVKRADLLTLQATGVSR